MGKKAKIGKQRKDKFYFLAKEAGFRSRAAFKLLQLNKRFEFLQQSRALVDLCAAPGGWLQVAEQNMPVSSLRIGVDLVPIKPIKNCITLQGDITEEKTRQAIRRELNKWEVDCVLHDGAPNVGTNWAHDAFQQNCLTLSALRLATQILRKGGFFVTKIFRSADFQTLIGVFEKLFKKVHIWKPAASRLESAEIFVVCEKFAKPDKIDPNLLDSKKVFSQQTDVKEKVNLHRLLLQPARKDKKPKALGYEDGVLNEYKELSASEFIHSKNALELLNRASALVLDSEQVAGSKHTTGEIRECVKDLKVCGPAEMRNILEWRKRLMAQHKKEEHNRIDEENRQSDPTNEIEMSEPIAQEVNIEDEQNSEMEELEEIDELSRSLQAYEKSKLKKQKKKLLKEKRKLTERKKLQMVFEGDVPTISEDLELFSLRTLKRIAQKAREKALSAASAVKGEDAVKIEMSMREHESGTSNDAMEKNNKNEKQLTIKHEQQKQDENEKYESDDLPDIMDDNDDDETRKRKFTAEQLAMGEQMVYSKKRSREIEEWAWNRYTSNDDDLPEWFVKDEKRHCRIEPPVNPVRVQFYAQKDRPMNVRSIKKVVEAKMRKKQRRERRMERAKKRAENIVGNEEMEHGEKIRELKRIYRKAAAPEKKKVKYQVVTKGKRGSLARPKGPYKLVDRRLKKDTRSMNRSTSKTSKGKGGRRARRSTKGNQKGRAKPTGMTNTKSRKF